ncbi:MAG: desulfoferrodoxin [Deltaproteobacteria bacterium]|nr:MAG: desulfoferrodoxin [Deltaproteobacteria bacterium]
MNRLSIFKCNVCGNIVEVVHVGGGQLVCCGQPMELLGENTTDAATEKHVPVIEKEGSNWKVRVGEVAHPMEEKHYIEWVQLISGPASYRIFLEPGGKPEAVFDISSAGQVVARELCNLHGLWKKE